ncbi:RNA polymerase factor sigma-54 [Tepidibacillus fermentans]|uniref:RNA polymerase RpoN-/SigL-like sigma 54 subunit n=1 Tax=Tepidibacillus fermentans TaxID=1281767 RepID=A0A4R3KGH9_9BACI|nr:RNA polymerase factor sigma-54 [Tepidibacillus fermentans]TCS81771.1 RNA polymerase RpoN-/SigL-like sigma 54 subunit [Tepidibacillus fermentans]
MQMDYGLYQQQTQKLMMTPELRQAITILQYPAIELMEYIQEQIIENPVLDIDEREWERYRYLYQNSRGIPSVAHSNDEGRNIWDTIASPEDNLEEYLLQQGRLLNLDAKKLQILAFLIGNLDELGYFTMSLREVAEILKVQEEEVEQMLTLLKSFDPIGIGSRDLREFLLIQLKQMEPYDEKAIQVVEHHLTDLGEKKFTKIARKMKISPEEVQQIADLIKTLKPKPVFGFEKGQTRYILPDIFVEEVEGEWIIIVNDTLVPRLRMNPYYSKFIEDRQMNVEAVKFVMDKWNQATWLIKSIERRRDTLYRVTREIIEVQKDFFTTHRLKPLTLKDIAEKTGIHESTVSRAIANKYVQTPKGTFELKFFFTHGITAKNGEFTSVNEVKRQLQELIENEDKRKPYSDQKLTELLNQKGVEISRRTVAKYREELEIPSSAKRKRYN